MEVEVNEQFRFACVWLTKEEENKPCIAEALFMLIKKYREEKYRFVIFHSGTQDLLELTRALLFHNKNLVGNIQNNT